VEAVFFHAPILPNSNCGFAIAADSARNGIELLPLRATAWVLVDRAVSLVVTTFRCSDDTRMTSVVNLQMLELARLVERGEAPHRLAQNGWFVCN